MKKIMARKRPAMPEATLHILERMAIRLNRPGRVYRFPQEILPKDLGEPLAAWNKPWASHAR